MLGRKKEREKKENESYRSLSRVANLVSRFSSLFSLIIPDMMYLQSSKGFQRFVATMQCTRKKLYMDIIETAIVSSYILLQVGTRRSIDRLIDVFCRFFGDGKF